MVLVVGMPFLFSQSFETRKCHNTDTDFECVEYLKNYNGGVLRVKITGVHPQLGNSVLIWVRGVLSPSARSSNLCERDLAKKARKLTDGFLIKTQPLKLFNVQREPSQRLVADVEAGGRSLRNFLLEQHLAYPDFGQKELDWCNSATDQVTKNDNASRHN